MLFQERSEAIKRVVESRQLSALLCHSNISPQYCAVDVQQWVEIVAWGYEVYPGAPEENAWGTINCISDGLIVVNTSHTVLQRTKLLRNVMLINNRHYEWPGHDS